MDTDISVQHGGMGTGSGERKGMWVDNGEEWRDKNNTAIGTQE